MFNLSTSAFKFGYQFQNGSRKLYIYLMLKNMEVLRFIDVAVEFLRTLAQLRKKLTNNQQLALTSFMAL